MKTLAFVLALTVCACSGDGSNNETTGTGEGRAVNDSCTPDAGECAEGLSCLVSGRDADNNDAYACGEVCSTGEALVGQCSGGRDCHPYRVSSFQEGLLGVCATDGTAGLDEPCSWPADCADGLTCTQYLDNPGNVNFSGTCRPTCDLGEGSEGCSPFRRDNPDGYAIGYDRDYIEVNGDCSGEGYCSNTAVCVTYEGNEICANTCDNVGTFCEDGSVCFEVGGSSNINGICYTYGELGESELCDGSPQCAPGLFCVDSEPSGRCARYCLEDEDCGEGEACDNVNGVEGGLCRVDIGGECINAAMCESGRLCSVSIDPALDELFPNGFCTDECVGDSDCGPGGVCRTVSGVDVCLRACESNLDCNFAFDEVCVETVDCGTTASLAACQDAVSGGAVCLPLQ